MVRLLVLLSLLALVAGCADTDEAQRGQRTPQAATATTSAGSTDSAPEASGSAVPRASGSVAPEHRTDPRPEPRPTLGIDASHHQGDIDWAAVAGDGYEFAYLKASEGSTFTDPRFADNRERARRAGLRVGGYHYFSLCSGGAAQAAHFVGVLGEAGRGALPPAVDLELAGSCTTPPGRAGLLAEVRTFLDAVERATGREPVVYLYPEFEAAYGFADELGGYRQWVRNLDGRPRRDWWMWQRSATATVAGVRGPADVNVLR